MSEPKTPVTPVPGRGVGDMAMRAVAVLIGLLLGTALGLIAIGHALLAVEPAFHSASETLTDAASGLEALAAVSLAVFIVIWILQTSSTVGLARVWKRDSLESERENQPPQPPNFGNSNSAAGEQEHHSTGR